MKVLVACDSFKGCMSSNKANQCIKKGIKKVNKNNEVYTYSIGDGGEGTMRAFHESMNGKLISCKVKDAYFKDIDVEYTLIEQGKTAVIDVASVIGLNQYERDERRPLYATSYGVGQLLLDAKNRKVKRIIIGLGGSSTNDGGMGLLNAIGVRFYDANHEYLKTSAFSLNQVKYVDFKPMINFDNIEIIVASDVKNKLLGKDGATYAFGKQKGLKPNQIRGVEQGMKNYADCFKYKGYDLNNIIGGGAAGGIGAVLCAVLKGKIQSGLELLFKYNHIEDKIKEVDLVITGEGQSDYQTAFGKAPVGVLNLAKKYNKPCLCISGALGIDYEKLYDEGFIGIFSIADRAMSFKQALACAPEKLEQTTYSIIKLITYYEEEK